MAARCPICTLELEDANAVRRHTLVAHGVSTAPAGSGWSSLPGPSEEPGWHPDPWNSACLRYWDGHEWSGKTAPLGSAPVEEAPAAKRRWGRGTGAPPAAATAPDTAAWPPAAPQAQPPPMSPPWAAGAPQPDPTWAATPAAPWDGPPPVAAPWDAPPPTAAPWTAAPPAADPPRANLPPPPAPPAPVGPAGPQDPLAAGPDEDVTAWAPAAPRQPEPQSAPVAPQPPTPPAWAAGPSPAPTGSAWAPSDAGAAPAAPAPTGPAWAAAVPAPDAPPAPTGPAWTADVPAPDAPPAPAPAPAGPAWAPAAADAPPAGPAPTGPAWAAPPAAWDAPQQSPAPAPAAWGSGPPPPPSGPAWIPPAAPSAPSRRFPKAALVGAAAGATALVLIVAAVALVGTSGKSAKHVTASAPTTTGPPPTTAAPAPLVSLSEGVLTADDLEGGWTVKEPLAALTQVQQTQGPCGSPLWAHDVGGYRSTFEDGAGGFEHTASITSIVREAPSDDAANAQAAYVTSAAYGPCVHAEFALDLAYALKSEGLNLDGMAVDPLPLDATIPESQAFVINVAVSDSKGDQVTVTVDHVEMIVGRYEGTMDISTNASLGIDQNALLQSQAERTLQRLQALPAGGTTVSRSV